MATHLPPPGGTLLNTLNFLDYAHAPSIAIFFIAALIFALCSLQTAKPIPRSNRKLQLGLVLILFQTVSYVISVISYLWNAFSQDRTPPQHALIHALGSWLVWACLGFALLSSKAPLWMPYFGSFVVGFLFESLICGLEFSMTSEYSYRGVNMMMYPFRVIISFLLVVDTYLLMVAERVEEGKDEESQTLLGSETNGSSDPVQKLTTYGSIATDSSDEDDEDEDDDDDKEVKKQQKKRLEEQGGWVGYLKSFGLFLPYLWPKHDRKVQFCFFILAVDVVMDRFLNILIPRQIGIVTNKLAEGTGVSK
jgi:hypothetical protein